MTHRAAIIPFPHQPSQEPGLATPVSTNASILDRPFMEFRPFGVNSSGEKIRDVSGVTVQANIEFLKEIISQTKGPEAAQTVIQDLCELLNGNVEKSRQRRSLASHRHGRPFAVLTYEAYAPRVKRTAAFPSTLLRAGLDEAFGKIQGMLF